MSAGKRVFSKTAHIIFLELLMRLGCLISKKLTEMDFWEKISLWGKCPEAPPKIGFFGFCQRIVHWCRFFGFKSCTIMTFIILLKHHVWEKSASWVNAKMLLISQITGFLNFNISKTIGGIKLLLLGKQVHIYHHCKLMMWF